MKRLMSALLLTIFVILLSIQTSSAEIKPFIEEYTYDASEADSKITSRVLALEQVKRLLLEKIGTYIESETEVKNFQLTKDQIRAYTAGFVKTEIIAEKWDGEHYWLRAKIDADPNDVARAIDKIRQDRMKVKEIEDAKKREDDALREVERLQKEIKQGKLDLKKYESAVGDIEFNSLVKEATTLEYDNKFIESEKVISKAIVTYPHATGIGYAYGLRAALNLRLQKYGQALEDVNMAIKLEPEGILFYGLRGKINYFSGRQTEAINDYTKVIELEPSAESYYGRGEALAILGQHQKALPDFDMAIRMKPKFANAYSARGSSYSQLGKYEMAIEDTTQAVNLEPQNAYAYQSRAAVNFTSKKYEFVISDATKAIELENAFADAYLYRGLAFSSLGKYREALKDLDRAIELNPQGSYGFVGRAMAFLNRGLGLTAGISDNLKAAQQIRERLSKKLEQKDINDLNMALKDFDRAIQLNPNESLIYTNRAAAYEGLRKYDLAIKDCDKALALDPNDVTSLSRRSRIYSLTVECHDIVNGKMCQHIVNKFFDN